MKRSGQSFVGKYDTEEKVVCHTPTPGKNPTRIPRWKYECLRAAILEVMKKNDGGVYFKDLPKLVEGVLHEADKAKLGSLPWHVVSVKLDMEVKGEISRIAGVSPQMLRMT